MGTAQGGVFQARGQHLCTWGEGRCCRVMGPRGGGETNFLRTGLGPAFCCGAWAFSGSLRGPWSHTLITSGLLKPLRVTGRALGGQPAPEADRARQERGTQGQRQHWGWEADTNWGSWANWGGGAAGGRSS